MTRPMDSGTVVCGRRALAAAGAVLAVLAVLSVPTADAAPDRDAFTPVMQRVVGPVWPVKGSDGRWHVVYDVQLSNVTSLGWRVRAIRIRAAEEQRRTVRTWSGRRVEDVLVSSGSGRTTRRIGPGEVAIAHLEFSRLRRSALPQALVHELSLENVTRSRGGPPRVRQLSLRTRVVQRRAAVLGPPLEGDRWLAADGCCTARRHVWAAQPFGGRLYNAQRFAIDFERLDASGRLWTGDETVLSNWAGYGARILAVADGTVVRRVDGLPNQVPGTLPGSIPIEEADGNAVFLRLRDGRIVFYAHMIPGSLTVKTGDRVRRGQVLGRVGNSGNSSAPHLHLHVMDRNAILAANGLPYVFDRYTITGRVASTDAFNHAELTGSPVRLGAVRTGVRRNALSLDQVILTWPASNAVAASDTPGA
jgi:peptidase M23-like protein